MALYETGYDDERFQHPVGHGFHCGICLNVIKDPVMCNHNEHLFCRACITRHLTNSQTCPSCMEPLTLKTLNEASRTVINLLSELKIRCDFFERGCSKYVELGDLDKHVALCGFAPAVCSNEGCQLEVNKQDLLHHETAVCELRRVKCHSCSDIRKEVDTMKSNMAAMNEKLKEVGTNVNTVKNDVLAIQVQMNERLREVGENVITAKDDVVAKVQLIQKQLNQQEESNRVIKADNEEIKKTLADVQKQLDGLAQQGLRKVQIEEQYIKDEISQVDGVDPKVVVVGGAETGLTDLHSVEVFSLLT